MIPTVRLNTSPAPSNIAVVRTQAPENQTTCIETPVHMNPCTPAHRTQTPEHLNTSSPVRLSQIICLVSEQSQHKHLMFIKTRCEYVIEGRGKS